MAHLCLQQLDLEGAVGSYDQAVSLLRMKQARTRAEIRAPMCTRAASPARPPPARCERGACAEGARDASQELIDCYSMRETAAAQLALLRSQPEVYEPVWAEFKAKGGMGAMEG